MIWYGVPFLELGWTTVQLELEALEIDLYRSRCEEHWQRRGGLQLGKIWEEQDTWTCCEHSISGVGHGGFLG
jgi:hypothetical protein